MTTPLFKNVSNGTIQAMVGRDSTYSKNPRPFSECSSQRKDFLGLGILWCVNLQERLLEEAIKILWLKRVLSLSVKLATLLLMIWTADGFDSGSLSFTIDLWHPSLPSTILLLCIKNTLDVRFRSHLTLWCLYKTPTLETFMPDFLAKGALTSS